MRGILSERGECRMGEDECSFVTVWVVWFKGCIQTFEETSLYILLDQTMIWALAINED